MKEPLVVIHGVANHNEAAFLEKVASLDVKLDRIFQIIPVFWGDLGGKSTDISDCLPKYEDGKWQVRSLAALNEQTPALQQQLVRDYLGGEKTVKQRLDLLAPGAAAAEFDVRGAEDSARQIIAAALETTAYLQFIDDEKTLAAVGESLAGILNLAREPQAEFAVRGARELSEALKTAIRKAIGSIDTSIGQTIEKKLGIGNQHIRDKFLPFVADFLGDVFVYQRQQDKIRRRILAAIDKAANSGEIEAGYGRQAKPVHLAAHSLGGVIGFDAAVLPVEDDEKLWLKSFTTFGSQAAFFQILDARQNLGHYVKNQPLTLPPSIAKWQNLWHPMDALAFTAGTVFRLHDGSKPIDIPVSGPASVLIADYLQTHGIYWDTDELVNALKGVLGT